MACAMAFAAPALAPQGAPPPPPPAQGAPAPNPIYGSRRSSPLSTAAAWILRAPSRSSGMKRKPHASRRNSTASPPGQAHGLRQLRILFAVQQPVRAVPPGEQPIQRMRRNLDQITTSLGRLRGSGSSGSFERDRRRKSVLAALGQNNCGPRYAAAATRAAASSTRCSATTITISITTNPNPDFGAPASTYKTVCVRTCDGCSSRCRMRRPLPASAITRQTCKNLCPAAEATLFTFRNNEHDACRLDQRPAVFIASERIQISSGVQSLLCLQGPGPTWAEAVKGVDDRGAAEQGDIIVTDERSKQMSQPRDAQGRPIRQPAQPKGGAAPATTDAPAAAPLQATVRSAQSARPSFRRSNSDGMVSRGLATGSPLADCSDTTSRPSS